MRLHRFVVSYAIDTRPPSRAQFANNPMFAGMADSIPEIKEALANPELLTESVAEMQKLLGGLGGAGADPTAAMGELMQKMMGGADMADMLSPEALEQGMAQAQAMLANMGKGMGGLDNDDGLMGGDESVKARVREQLASLMRDRRFGDDEPAVQF